MEDGVRVVVCDGIHAGEYHMNFHNYNAMISQGVSCMPSCTSVAVIIWSLFTISSWSRVCSALSHHDL